MLLPRSRAVRLHVYWHHHHPHTSHSSSRPFVVAVRCYSDTMPKASRVYFAVRVGREPGIYETWEECHKQVVRYPRAVFKKLRSLDKAKAFVNERGGTPDPTESDIEPADSLSQTRASVDSSLPTKASQSSSTIAPTPVAGPSNSPLSAAAGPSQTTRLSSSVDVVYTDGACSRNGQAGSVGGIGVWWGPGDPRNISERCPGSRQTNNRAELIAIIRALETAPTTSTYLVIKSDSKYAMRCIHEWLPKWREKKKFRTLQGTPVKNAELILYAEALISWREKAGQAVELRHVPGHAGDVGNEGADKLAVRGCFLHEVNTANWVERRLQVERKKAAMDASMFADMILNDEQLLAELEENSS
ncbi:ribonuclease H-like domain-containing protein, partial [Lactarius indigo]